MDDPQKNILFFNYNDEKFFNEIFDQYYLSLFYYALNFVRHQDIAEDVVQETFLKIWEKKERIKTGETIKSYLYVAVKNKCLDYLKHHGISSNYKNAASPEHSYSDNTDHLVIEAEIKAKLQDAIDALPEQCRMVFILSRYQNLKQKEIAKKMGISLKTVENHMGKALQIIREKMKDYL